MSEERWQKVTIDDAFAKDPQAWLAKHANEDLPWLLAHADDGVIWGKYQEDGSLKLSGDVFKDPKQYPAVAVKLCAQTLQQARLFGPTGELLVWRTDDGFAARLIADGPDCPPDAIEEENLLWGLGRSVESGEGFTLLQEGQRGQRHAPPVSAPAVRNTARPALLVRHYVDYDDEDQAYVSLSRLVKLEPERRTR